MAAYVVGAAVFVLGSTVLIQFVLEPPGNPGASLAQQDLKSKAAGTLDVLMGTAGYPSNWDTASADNVARLGLVEEGSSVRLDPGKFGSLARGRFIVPSDANGAVDYPEAKRALGLEAYDFRLRASPLIPEDAEGFYGTKGMGDYRVAYIRNLTTGVESLAATMERGSLDALDVGFRNKTPSGLLAGDVYDDDGSMLKTYLVPLLGTRVTQVAISSGNGNDFHRVNSTDFSSLVVVPGSQKALAMADFDSKGKVSLGYTKGRELRAIVANANLSNQLVATISWKEHVNTNGTSATRDDGDYGFLEVSPDGGATWVALTNTPATRSQDSPTRPQAPGIWTVRSVDLTTANCPLCLDNEDVQIAFHWVADADTNKGYGWIIDDVSIKTSSAPTATTLMSENFETPAYDLVIVGSGVKQTALTSAEVKNALRDYVTSYGGRLIVLGGDTNNQWLQPLFHAGVGKASPGVSNPDPTHPLLVTPNSLDWTSYSTAGKAWGFGSAADEDLFTMVVGTGDDQHVLTATSSGAFGTDGGGIILTTWQPWTMASTQRLMFTANAITYGSFHHLYMDLGPPIPSDVPVATASRTAVMEKNAKGNGEYTEIGFTLYLWSGNVTPPDDDSPYPSTPASFTATPRDGEVKLTWTAPRRLGDVFQGYTVYRGTTPGTLTKLVDLPTTALAHTDTGRTNGVTYYYRVAGRSNAGEGASTAETPATPATTPGMPESFTAAGAAGQIVLTWKDPATNGGAAITGYRIYRGDTSAVAATPTYLYKEVGAVDEYVDTNVGSAQTKYYRISAFNAIGESVPTAVVGGTTPAVPAIPPTPTATPGIRSITIGWSAPSSAAAITEYHIFAGDEAGTTTQIAIVPSTQLSYTESGLNNSQARYYRVRANSSAGVGGLSDTVGATTLSVSTAPTAFTATGGADSIVLTWGPPTDPGAFQPSLYRIYRGETSGSLTPLADVPGGNTTFTDAMVPDAATRWYRISAVTDVDEGLLSDEKSATSHDIPSAPTLTLIPDLSKITLQWTPPANTGGTNAYITGYKIYRGTDGIESVQYYKTSSGTQGTITFTDTPLDPAVTYWYYVTAVAGPNEGVPSNVESAKPLGVTI